MKGSSYSARLECPGCGSASLTACPDGSLICDYCHTTYVPPERACPVCGAPYELDARHCPSCGVDLVRECPACGALNPSVAGKCLVCGQEMEILDSLFERVTGTRADWLRQVREEAPAIKAQEKAASQARLAEMWAAETRRRETLAQARAERDRQQRIIVTVTVSTVVLVVVAVLIALAVILGRTPSPYFSY
jgi:predicted amidophosphoribosyltransferase